MDARRRRTGIGAYLLIFLVMIGCSPPEEPPMDAGVSPFYPGPRESEKATVSADAAGGPSAGDVRRPVMIEPVRPGTGGIGRDHRPEDVERQLRIAMRTAEKGDTAKAVSSLDRILAFQPLNREALLGRACLAMMQADKAPAAADRAAGDRESGTLMRTLRRAYEKPTKPEIKLFAQKSSSPRPRSTPSRGGSTGPWPY